jgi:hypothetical protein
MAMRRATVNLKASWFALTLRHGEWGLTWIWEHPSMSRFATSSYARAAATTALRERFSRPEAVTPCRHCGLTTCLCGQVQRTAVLALARLVLPLTTSGDLRLHRGDMDNAIRQADWRGATAVHLSELGHRSAACARTARTDGASKLAAIFESLAQDARVAAVALPR